jgi:hypothetical protein
LQVLLSAFFVYLSLKTMVVGVVCSHVGMGN